MNYSLSTPKPPTLRDWAAVGFRRGRLIAISFLFVFGSIALMTLISPRQYEGDFKIMVKRERAETLVTPDDKSQTGPPEITELDLNSEAELLKSRDLLEKVVIATGVPSGDRPRVYRATAELERNLVVEPLKKTTLIKVTYRSRSPREAETVLQTLSRLYFEKHLEVHRAPGALAFFQTQTEQYREKLKDAEAAMTKFDDDKGVVEGTVSKEISVRQLNEFEAELKRTRAAVSETEQRIGALEEQYAATAPRLTTQVRTSTNPMLLQQLKSTLLNLELKRTELLSKFAPDYRPVQEVEQQIAQTREAVDNAEKNPVREETTDRDATHGWLESELAKSRAELKGLQAKVAATAQIVDSYRQQTRKLNEAEMGQQDLVRQAKAAEENFLLYSRKQEEARISNALDRRRIVNISIAQPPAASPSPVSPRWTLNLALGFLLAVLVSIVLALTVDQMDPSFRTPDEVEAFLNLPVLAALPADYAPESGAPLVGAVRSNKEYVLITAARNEEAHIRKTLESVVNQTRLPKVWIVVSDSSTDRTDEFVREFAARYDFIRLLRLENGNERCFSSKAFALNAAYKEIKHLQFDFVGILDSDISLSPDYYEQLLARFDANSRLGLAGAAIVEDHGGRWELRSGDSLIDVGGQMPLFRRECYEDVGDFAPLRWGGEDTVANMMARRKGWKVRVFPELRACHHRRTGTASASVWRARFRDGMGDYFLGYHPLFMLAKCVRRIVEPPYVIGSVLRLSGYIWPRLIRQRPAMPADFIEYLRRYQIQRLLRVGGNG